MTHSFVASTLSKVCLVVFPLTRLAGEKMAIGGFALKTLKKLKGAKLGFPSAFMVLTNVMGRGATALNNSPCNCGVSISDGVKLLMGVNLDTKVSQWWLYVQSFQYPKIGVGF